MHPFVEKISPLSDYYFYTPSVMARKLYLYPICLGYFIYEPGYYISRKNYDSFLVMYITTGHCDITIGNKAHTATAGDFVLLDCYLPHRYGSKTAFEASWLHFDGILARNYFWQITSHYGSVMKYDNPKMQAHMLDKICNCFRNALPINEAVMSLYITNLLNGLLPPPQSQKSNASSSIVANSLAFINEHFRQPISLQKIAEEANMSLYHFSRIFALETGFTPHQYLINMRLSAAKYMLTSSDAAIKDIAFDTGFNSESYFCAAFKKAEHMTPNQYRRHILPFSTVR